MLSVAPYCHLCELYLELAGGTWSLTSGHVVGYPAPRAQGQANDNQLQEGFKTIEIIFPKMTDNLMSSLY
jgi:hypothetical protein